MLRKWLFNANTNDEITCLKDLQSNCESDWICSKVMLYNEVCSYPYFYTQLESRHVQMHKLPLLQYECG